MTVAPFESEALPPSVAPYGFDCSQFDKMIEAGVFGDEDVELLQGMIYPIMTESERHQLTVERIVRLLRSILSDLEWHVREEKHIQILEHWKPRPDIHVVRGSFESYWQTGRQPTLDDVVLLVEVCETTHDRDENFKVHGYALSGAPVYWFVDIRRSLIRVYSDPRGEGFAKEIEYRDLDELPIIIAGERRGSVPVAELMPPWPRPKTSLTTP